MVGIKNATFLPKTDCQIARAQLYITPTIIHRPTGTLRRRRNITS